MKYKIAYKTTQGNKKIYKLIYTRKTRHINYEGETLLKKFMKLFAM